MKEEIKNDELVKLMAQVYHKIGEYVDNQNGLNISLKEQILLVNKQNEQIQVQDLKIQEQKNEIIKLNEYVENQKFKIKEQDLIMQEQSEQIMLQNSKFDNLRSSIVKIAKELVETKEQLEETKRSIILSTENANRSGRPPLTDEEVKAIRAFLAQGMTQRKVAETVGVSNGAVAKYSKIESDKKEVPRSTSNFQ